MSRSTIAVLLLIASASANAQGFDYNYLQLEYTNIELDDVSVDGDGFGLSGSYAINPDWHVFAGYQAAGLDFGVDATFLAAGIGYNTELSPVVDAYARLSYQYIDLDTPSFGSVDDNGLGFDVGLRYAASKDLELNAGIEYVDFGDGGDDTGFYAGALWKFTDAFALGLGGSWADDVSAYTLSGRVYFGK
jgi:long-subunit fatty acid transport protein